MKKTTEDSRKCDRKDILCVRDWPGLKKVEPREETGDIQFLRRKARKNIEIGEFERGTL